MAILFPENEAKRIEALRRYRILDTPAEQAFDDFALLASTICETPIAMMTLVDGDRQWFKSREGIESTETAREHAFCAYTILGNEVMVVEDATCDARFANNPYVVAAPHVRFYAGAPLIDSEGYALGSLCVIDSEPRLLTNRQRQVLEALARQVIAQLELRRISAELAEALHGLLPICSHCKCIRDDSGYWQNVETYVKAHTGADFSHGICPDCLKQHYAEYAGRVSKEAG
jgi:GAF domain-containing protein